MEPIRRPPRQELIPRGGWPRAIWSAPAAVWAGTVLLLGEHAARAVIDRHVVTIVLLPFGLLFAGMVLAGIRAFWQISLVVAAGDIFFVLAPDNSIWQAGVGAAALILLLLPASREYFRPGRTWMPRRLEDMAVEDWERGGTRYLRLRERLPAHVAPRQVLAFFIAFEGEPPPALFLLFRRQYVIAATADGVVVVRIRPPAVFSATLGGIVADLPADDPRLAWDGETFAIDGHHYRPIQHHEADADEVARRLQLAGRTVAQTLNRNSSSAWQM